MDAKEYLENRGIKGDDWAIINRGTVIGLMNDFYRIKSAEEAEEIDEEMLQQDFKDWLGWNDQDPPDQHDPDHYTYSWGMSVWCNAYKAYKAAFGKEE